jgi:hypothetical protein
MHSTHATVSPSSLLPATQDGRTVGSKLVDFAVTLARNDKLSTALSNLPQPRDGDVRSLNHTRFETLIDRPIAISIETKPEGGDSRHAETQLAIWVAAHLSHLEQLASQAETGTSVILPWLPLLIAVGPRWYFLCAQRTEDGKTVSLHDQMYPIPDH